ncbi:TetR/AcrR family transcriptional regulator [Actinocatenispora comari]|jgi:AcrR family transcriptional regulator|uniref:TetR family transcriptional regulator n=1 Tax=Actinocatenispora comari TaxID=2807577 RepID=A0A8J4AGT4_9ACTN|nr:TetR/AcrR family transcriptional regulator [Actinocatenispora comari]GIL30853.1 TetR family transcriptional regulator [Actinocatenispora comari]
MSAERNSDVDDSTRAAAARRGRPRSERARRAVLAAARELLTDRGLPGLSVDDIASHAGVSKATIYRWWPTKAAVLMDAFTDAVEDRMTFPTGDDPLGRLREQLGRVARLMNEPAARRPFVALVAASQHDPELAAALRDRFVAGRRAAARELVIEAVRAGQLAAGTDPDTVLDMLYGALYYRLLVSGDPLTPDYPDHLVDTLGARPPVA